MLLFLIITICEAVTYKKIEKGTYLQLNSSSQGIYDLTFTKEDLAERNMDSHNPFIVVVTEQYVDVNECIIVSLDRFQELIQLREQCKKSQLLYDRESILTRSDTHVIRTSFEVAYIYAGQIRDSRNKFNLNVVRSQSSCLKDCSNSVNQTHGVCRKGQCNCIGDYFQAYFGSYCQYKLHKIKQDSILTITLKTQTWEYIQLDLDDYTIQKDLYLVTEEVLQDVIMSFSYPIPTMFWENYVMKASLESTYSVTTYLNGNKLRIGFFNQHKFPLQFYIKLSTLSDQAYRISSLYWIIFVVIAILIMVIVACTIMQRRKQRMQQRTQNPSGQRRKVKKNLGFSPLFISEYFPPYLYGKVVDRYPSFLDSAECVICLETMKQDNNTRDICRGMDSDYKLSPDQLIGSCDHSASFRAKLGELYMVSVTPCFHMFHHACLFRWFQNQKHCPICRKNYDEKVITQRGRWIDLGPDILSSPSLIIDNLPPSQRNNEYILRMRTKVPDDQNTINKLLTTKSTFTNQGLITDISLKKG